VAAGNISVEYWNGISGSNVSAIPVNMPATTTGNLTIFEIPGNSGTNYGTRVRGFICAPATGDYTFWIASNDNSELWLSTDSGLGNKIKIASVTGATGIRQWDKYPSQRSISIALVQNKRYYIEALHKQGSGTDNLAVGWQIPNGTFERPVPGKRLSPFSTDVSAAPVPAPIRTTQPLETSGVFSVYPNPMKENVSAFSISMPQSDEHYASAVIDITTVTGENVHADEIPCDNNCASIEVNMDKKLSAGVYLVAVRVNGRRYTQRLFVR
jgi:hypothetical protein